MGECEGGNLLRFWSGCAQSHTHIAYPCIPAPTQAETFFAAGVTIDSFGSDQWVEGEAGVDVLVTSAGIGRFGNIEDLRCAGNPRLLFLFSRTLSLFDFWSLLTLGHILQPRGLFVKFRHKCQGHVVVGARGLARDEASAQRTGATY